MELFNLLAITAGILFVLLIVLVLVAALSAPRPQMYHEHDSDDLQQIKDQIEHEGELEAEEELMPYKPPRLDRPTQKRL